MIPFQEEVCPSRFNSGEWEFEVHGDKGRYQLITFPEGGEFQLTYSNGHQDQGKIDDIFKLRNKLLSYEPGLIQWVYQIFHFCHYEQHRIKYKFEKKEIVLEDRKYIFEFCPRNEEVKLIIPGMATVVKRSVMSETFPEIYSMERGLVSQLIQDIVFKTFENTGKDYLGDKYEEKKITTPLIFQNPKEYLIGNNRYLISYDQTTDLLFLLSETRNIKTYLGAIDALLPELKTMHQGMLSKQINEFVEQVKQGKVLATA